MMRFRRTLALLIAAALIVCCVPERAQAAWGMAEYDSMQVINKQDLTITAHVERNVAGHVRRQRDDEVLY